MREHSGLQLGKAAILKRNVPGNIPDTQRNEMLEKTGLKSSGRPVKLEHLVRDRDGMALLGYLNVVCRHEWGAALRFPAIDMAS